MRWFQAMSMAVVAVAVSGTEARAQDTGTRVTIQLAQAAGELPEPEKLVQAVTAVSGERQVRLMVKNAEGTHQLTLDLWGAVVPAADIPRTLREAFPVLAQATIETSTLDASQKPSVELRDAEVQTSGDGTRRIVKKRVVVEETK